MKARRKKFKHQLVQQAKREQCELRNQERLKDKYKLDEDVVVVEKSNTVKFLVKMIAAMIKIVVTITIFLLTVIGLAALVYPSTRHELWLQGLQIYRDLLRLLPWG